MKIQKHKCKALLIGVVAAFTCFTNIANACTGISLKGADGTFVVGRTFEWGAFDFQSQIMIIPRGHRIVSHTPEGLNGLEYTTKFGIIGMDAAGELGVADGMNEKGLVVGAYFLPGFAELAPYKPSNSSQTMGPTELMLFLLSQYQTVAEVKVGLNKIIVAPVILNALGFPAPLHYLVTDKTGSMLVIEYVNGGELKLYEATLGVLTNSPTYDWHINNIRNYIGLSKEGLVARELSGQSFGPFGAGSGMFGLPGDSTPPSRFIQAVALTQTARPTDGGLDTINETFRILDHFNIATSGAEGADDADSEASQQIPSATQWTVAADTKNLIFYYHTAWNRRVRMIDLKKIDFDSVKFQRIAQDRDRKQDVEEVFPK